MGKYRRVPTDEGMWDLKCPKRRDRNDSCQIKELDDTFPSLEVTLEVPAVRNEADKLVSSQKASGGGKGGLKGRNDRSSASKAQCKPTGVGTVNQESSLLTLDDDKVGFEYVGHCIRYRKLDSTIKTSKIGSNKTVPTDVAKWHYAIVKYWDPKWRVLFVHHLREEINSNLDEAEVALLLRDTELDSLLSDFVVWIETVTFEVHLVKAGRVFRRSGWYGGSGEPSALSPLPPGSPILPTPKACANDNPSSDDLGEGANIGVLSPVSRAGALPVNIDYIVDIEFRESPMQIEVNETPTRCQSFHRLSDGDTPQRSAKEGDVVLDVPQSDEVTTVPFSTEGQPAPRFTKEESESPPDDGRKGITVDGKAEFTKIVEDPEELTVHKCCLCDKGISCFVDDVFQKNDTEYFRTCDDTLDFNALVESVRSIMRMPNNAFTSLIHAQHTSMHDIGHLKEADVYKLLEDNLDITRLVMHNMLDGDIPLSDRFQVAICVKMIIWLRHLSGYKGKIATDSTFNVVYWGVRCSDCGKAYHARCLPYYHLTKGPPLMRPDTILMRERHHDTMCRLYRSYASMKPGGSSISHYRADYLNATRSDASEYTPTLCTEVLHDISPYLSVSQPIQHDLDTLVGCSSTSGLRSSRRIAEHLLTSQGSKVRSATVDSTARSIPNGDNPNKATSRHARVSLEDPKSRSTVQLSNQSIKESRSVNDKTVSLKAFTGPYSATNITAKSEGDSLAAVVDKDKPQGTTILPRLASVGISSSNIPSSDVPSEDRSVVFVPYLERQVCQPWKCESCTVCVYCCLPTRTETEEVTLTNDQPPFDDPKNPYSRLYFSSLLEKLDAICVKPKDRREVNFVRCVSCNVSAHKKCCNPVIKDFAFVESWRCESCLQCICCGYRDSAGPNYMNWGLFFLFCLRCWQSFEKSNYCGVCYKIWTSFDNVSYRWIQCDGCRLWVHIDCDPSSHDVSTSGNAKNAKYNCPACRSPNKLHRMFRVLELVFNLDRYNQFRYPMPSTYTAYWSIVTCPMDLTTIRKKLEFGMYNIFEEFVFDILITSYNAKIFNMPNTKVFKITVGFESRCRQLMSGVFGINDSDMDLILQCGMRHAKLETFSARIERIISGIHIDKTAVTPEIADECLNVDELNAISCKELKHHLKFDEFDGCIKLNRQSYLYRNRCYQKAQSKRLDQRLGYYNPDYLLSHLGIPEFLYNVDNTGKLFPLPTVRCGLQFPVVNIIYPRNGRSFRFPIAFSPDENLIKPMLWKNLVLYDYETLGDVDRGGLLYSSDANSLDIMSTYYSENMESSEGLWTELCVVCGSSAYNNYMVFCVTCGEAFHYYCAGLLFPPQFVQYSNFRCAGCAVCDCCSCRVVSNHIYDLININDFRLANALGWTPKLIDYTGLKLCKDMISHLLNGANSVVSGDEVQLDGKEREHVVHLKSRTDTKQDSILYDKVKFARSKSGGSALSMHNSAKCDSHADGQGPPYDSRDMAKTASKVHRNGSCIFSSGCQPPLVNVRCCFCGSCAHLKCTIDIAEMLASVGDAHPQRVAVNAATPAVVEAPNMVTGEPLFAQQMPLVMPTAVGPAISASMLPTPMKAPPIPTCKTGGQRKPRLGGKKAKAPFKPPSPVGSSANSGTSSPGPRTPKIMPQLPPNVASGTEAPTTGCESTKFVSAGGDMLSVAYADPHHSVLNPPLQGVPISHAHPAISTQQVYVAATPQYLDSLIARNDDCWSNMRFNAGTNINLYQHQVLSTPDMFYSTSGQHMSPYMAFSALQSEYSGGFYNVSSQAVGHSGMIVNNSSPSQYTANKFIHNVGSIGSEFGFDTSQPGAVSTLYHPSATVPQSITPQASVSASCLPSVSMYANVQFPNNSYHNISGPSDSMVHVESCGPTLTASAHAIQSNNEYVHAVSGLPMIYNSAPSAPNCVLNTVEASMYQPGIGVPGTYGHNNMISRSDDNIVENSARGIPSDILPFQGLPSWAWDSLVPPLVTSDYTVQPSGVESASVCLNGSSTLTRPIYGSSMRYLSHDVGMKSEGCIPFDDTRATKMPTRESSFVQCAGGKFGPYKRRVEATFYQNNSKVPLLCEKQKPVVPDNRQVWQHDGSGIFACGRHPLPGFPHLHTNFQYPHQRLFKICRIPDDDLLLKFIFDTVRVGTTGCSVNDELYGLESMDVSHMEGCSYSTVFYQTLINSRCVCCGVPIQVTAKGMDRCPQPDSSSLVMEKGSPIQLPPHLSIYEMCRECRLWRGAFMKGSPDSISVDPLSSLGIDKSVFEPFDATNESSAGSIDTSLLTSTECIKTISLTRHWNLLSENVFKYLTTVVKQWITMNGNHLKYLENDFALSQFVNHMLSQHRFSNFKMRSQIYSGLVHSPLSPTSFLYWADSLRNCNPSDEQLEEVFNQVSKEYHPHVANAGRVSPITDANVDASPSPKGSPLCSSRPGSSEEAIGFLALSIGDVTPSNEDSHENIGSFSGVGSTTRTVISAAHPSMKSHFGSSGVCTGKKQIRTFDKPESDTAGSMPFSAADGAPSHTDGSMHGIIQSSCIPSASDHMVTEVQSECASDGACYIDRGMCLRDEINGSVDHSNVNENSFGNQFGSVMNQTGFPASAKIDPVGNDDGFEKVEPSLFAPTESTMDPNKSKSQVEVQHLNNGHISREISPGSMPNEFLSRDIMGSPNQIGCSSPSTEIAANAPHHSSSSGYQVDKMHVTSNPKSYSAIASPGPLQADPQPFDGAIASYSVIIGRVSQMLNVYDSLMRLRTHYFNATYKQSTTKFMDSCLSASSPFRQLCRTWSNLLDFFLQGNQNVGLRGKLTDYPYMRRRLTHMLFSELEHYMEAFRRSFGLCGLTTLPPSYPRLSTFDYVTHCFSFEGTAILSFLQELEDYLYYSDFDMHNCIHPSSGEAVPKPSFNKLFYLSQYVSLIRNTQNEVSSHRSGGLSFSMRQRRKIVAPLNICTDTGDNLASKDTNLNSLFSLVDKMKTELDSAFMNDSSTTLHKENPEFSLRLGNSLIVEIVSSRAISGDIDVDSFGMKLGGSYICGSTDGVGTDAFEEFFEDFQKDSQTPVEVWRMHLIQKVLPRRVLILEGSCTVRHSLRPSARKCCCLCQVPFNTILRGNLLPWRDGYVHSECILWSVDNAYLPRIYNQNYDTLLLSSCVLKQYLFGITAKDTSRHLTHRRIRPSTTTGNTYTMVPEDDNNLDPQLFNLNLLDMRVIPPVTLTDKLAHAVVTASHDVYCFWCGDIGASVRCTGPKCNVRFHLVCAFMAANSELSKTFLRMMVDSKFAYGSSKDIFPVRLYYTRRLLWCTSCFRNHVTSKIDRLALNHLISLNPRQMKVFLALEGLSSSATFIIAKHVLQSVRIIPEAIYLSDVDAHIDESGSEYALLRSEFRRRMSFLKQDEMVSVLLDWITKPKGFPPCMSSIHDSDMKDSCQTCRCHRNVSPKEQYYFNFGWMPSSISPFSMLRIPKSSCSPLDYTFEAHNSVTTPFESEGKPPISLRERRQLIRARMQLDRPSRLHRQKQRRSGSQSLQESITCFATDSPQRLLSHLQTLQSAPGGEVVTLSSISSFLALRRAHIKLVLKRRREYNRRSTTHLHCFSVASSFIASDCFTKSCTPKSGPLPTMLNCGQGSDVTDKATPKNGIRDTLDLLSSSHSAVLPPSETIFTREGHTSTSIGGRRPFTDRMSVIGDGRISDFVSNENEIPRRTQYRRLFSDMLYGVNKDDLEPDLKYDCKGTNIKDVSELVRTGSLTILDVGGGLIFDYGKRAYPAGFTSVRIFWSNRYHSRGKICASIKGVVHNGVPSLLNGRGMRASYLCTIRVKQCQPYFTISLLASSNFDMSESTTIAQGFNLDKVFSSFMRDIGREASPRFSAIDFFGLNHHYVVQELRIRFCKGLLNRSAEFFNARFFSAAISGVAFPRSANKLKSMLRYGDSVSLPPSEGEGFTRAKQLPAIDFTSAHLQKLTFNGLPLNPSLDRHQFDFAVPSSHYRYLSLIQPEKRLEVRNSTIHGFGLFVTEDIAAGEPVVEYVGELIREHIGDEREETYAKEQGGDGSCYMFRLDEELIVDATRKGSMSRFINHSCEPNCVCRIVTCDKGLKHIVVFAKVDLKAGAEVTYDYKFGVEGDGKKLVCLCGSASCMGRMN